MFNLLWMGAVTTQTSMTHPKISIITVTFNAEATIRDTLQSVVGQQYDSKEIIVIDGLSTDGTMDVIRESGNRVAVCLSEPDEGIPDALNKGVARATGDWLFFLSSDDVFCDEHVLERVAGQLAGRTGLVYGDVVLKSSGRRYDGAYDPEKLVRQNICHQAQYFHRSIFDRVGLYNVRYKYLSDWDLSSSDLCRSFNREALCR